MADILTILEDKLDAHYRDRTAKISDARFVPSWDDYNFRAGYLEAIREVGVLIKQIRSPEEAQGTGEISDILTPAPETQSG